MMLYGLSFDSKLFEFCPSGRLTADKREIIDFPKLPSATSYMLKPLYEIPNPASGGKFIETFAKPKPLNPSNPI